MLTTEGAIVLEGGRHHDAAALPRLLHELLAVVPHPTPLRLFVLHAISSDGDKLPAAFGEALAYYERPGREELIQTARQKCLDTPLPLPGSALPEPLAEPETEASQEPSAPPSRRRRRLVAVSLGMCACAVVVIVATGQRGPGGSATGLGGAADALLANVAETGRDVARALAEELTSGLGNRPATVPVEETTREPSELRAKGRPRRSALTVRPAAVTGHTETEVLVPEAPTPEIIEPVPAVADVDRIDAAVDTIDTDESLTEDTSVVVPPRLLEPVRLPSWVDPVSKVSFSALELEISAEGIVERVTLASPAVRLTDMMILSAAKTWLFEPASMNGQPVPYRLTLGLASNR